MAIFNGKQVFFSPKIHSVAEGSVEITENGTHNVSEYAEAIVNVVGAVEPGPELDATFANNTWANIIWACKNNAVPETWAVGDEKTMTIDGNDVVIAICGKNHDEYADGGLAPLTFIQKTAFMSAQMHSELRSDSIFATLGHTPYTETDMYKTTLPSVLEMMPDGIKENLRAVKKKNVYAMYGNAFFETADKIWLFSEREVGVGWNYYLDGKKYGYAFGYCSGVNGETDIWFFLRSLSSPDRFTIYMTGGGPSDTMQTDTLPLIFGFCF